MSPACVDREVAVKGGWQMTVALCAFTRLEGVPWFTLEKAAAYLGWGLHKQWLHDNSPLLAAAAYLALALMY